jgi:hypothetical protein
MRIRQSFSLALGLAAALYCTMGVSEARPARCSASNEGNVTYRCRFIPRDRNGSFQISAPGRPTFILNIVEQGIAEGFVNFGGLQISLGRYTRDQNQPACWVSDLGRGSICAW